MIRLRTTCLLLGLVLLSIRVATVVAQDAPPPEAPAPEQTSSSPEGRPWLGLVGDDQGRSAGVRIVELRPESPAVAAGLLVGDLITGAAGVELKTLQDMADLMKQVKPGEQIELDVVRAGRRRSVSLRLATRPAPPAVLPESSAPAQPSSKAAAAAENGRPYLGVRVVASAEGDGAQVERVEAYSPAHDGGLRPGQRIVSIDGRPIATPEDLAQAMANIRPRQEIQFGVVADNQSRDITVTVGTAPAAPPTPPQINPDDLFAPNAPDPKSVLVPPRDDAPAIQARIQELERELEALRTRLRRIQGDQ